jgi:hypothetical protein
LEVEGALNKSKFLGKFSRWARLAPGKNSAQDILPIGEEKAIAQRYDLQLYQKTDAIRGESPRPYVVGQQFNSVAASGGY